MEERRAKATRPWIPAKAERPEPAPGLLTKAEFDTEMRGLGRLGAGTVLFFALTQSVVFFSIWDLQANRDRDAMIRDEEHRRIGEVLQDQREQIHRIELQLQQIEEGTDSIRTSLKEAHFRERQENGRLRVLPRREREEGMALESTRLKRSDHRRQ